MDRRSLLIKFRSIFGWVLFSETILSVFAFLFHGSLKSRKKKEISLLEVGPLDYFELGSVTAFRKGGFYLVRSTNGAFLALSRKCTHLGCTVPWIEEEELFRCPCHASVFNREGDILKSPATRPLDYIPLVVKKGILFADYQNPIRRAQVSKDQWLKVEAHV